MSGIAPIPDEPLRCSEPPLWAKLRHHLPPPISCDSSRRASQSGGGVLEQAATSRCRGCSAISVALGQKQKLILGPHFNSLGW